MRHKLAAVDVFQDVPLEMVAHLAEQGHQCTFHAGDQLLRQGEVNASMHVILRGRVRLEWTHSALSEPVDGLELGPGEEVGARGVLDGEPCRMSVRAVEETETLALSALTLTEVLLQYPVLSVGLLPNLSRRCRSLEGLDERARQLRLEAGGRAADG
jgi:CRP-like cAMP-binding protein